MRTVNLVYDVIWPLARKMGYDPRIDLSDDMAAAYVGFINLWVRKLYDLFDWPEWTFIDFRTPDPVTHYVPWDEPGQPVIGRVMKVYLRDPTEHDSIVDTPFRLNQAGIFCGLEHGTNVWIKYIQPAPQYTSVLHDLTFTYPKDWLVLNFDINSTAPDQAGTYRAVQANIGHPLSDPAYWALVPFPEQLQVAVLRGAYAEALREDGQNDKADAEEKAALIDAQLTLQIQVHDSYDEATDQSVSAPRYRPIKLAAPAAK
jgi:hypothetical protein